MVVTGSLGGGRPVCVCVRRKNVAANTVYARRVKWNQVLQRCRPLPACKTCMLERRYGGAVVYMEERSDS